MQWAFVERRIELPRQTDPAPLPTTLSAAQRAILQTLHDQEQLWDRTNGNASLCFMRVDLPFDRAAVGELLAAQHVE